MKRRPPLSRRTFLKLTATVAAGAALAGCTPKESTVQPTDTATVGIPSSVPPSPTAGSAPSDTPSIETNPTETSSNPEPSATPGPASLVTMCREAGAKRVRVRDYPFGGTAKSAYAISGIEEAVEAAGGEMQVMSHAKYTVVKIPEGRDLTSVSIYPDILEADLLVTRP